MIHLYAIGTKPLPAPLRGIEAAPVEQVGCGGLLAAVSTHDHAAPMDERRVREHAAVVEAISACGGALPIRFGTRYSEASRLQDALMESRERFVALLDRVGACVEFAVRAAHPAAVVAHPRPPAGESGRAYLQRRLAEEREREAQVAALRDELQRVEVLDPLARESAERTGRRGPERVFLVERVAAEEFRAAAASLLTGRDDLVLTGPWPPYSFVDDETGRRTGED
jgi:hypothetical protein